jgi:cell wall assembly regulator SMI1
VLAAISRIDRWLAAHRANYYARLQLGAEAAALDAFESRFALQLPAAFRELYQWRNGQDSMSYDALVMNRSFMNLQDIADAKELLDDMIDSDFDDPRYWRRGWVPFLHNGGGSYLCVDLRAEDGGTPGQLIGFWKADQDRPIEHPSVEAWLNSLADTMERGALKLV